MDKSAKEKFDFMAVNNDKVIYVGEAVG